MIFGFLSRLARVRITLGYAFALVSVSVALVVLGPRVREHVIVQASTNLHNLAHGHLGTLFGSAFVTDAGPMWFWLPGLVCLLALAELIWRSGRLALVFVTGHVGATLLVAVGLTAAIEFGWLPLSIARASDVGVSYGAVAVLGALTAAVPRRVAAGVDRLVAPDRHRVRGVGRRLHRRRSLRGLGAGHAGLHPVAVGPAQWTPVRYALLAGGAELWIPDVGARRVDDAGRRRRRRFWALWRLWGLPAPARDAPSTAGGRVDGSGAGTQRLTRSRRHGRQDGASG